MHKIAEKKNTTKSKIKKIIIATVTGLLCILVIGTGYFIGTKKLLIMKGELGPIEIINKSLGPSSARVLDYVHYTLGDINLVFPLKVKPIKNEELKEIAGNDTLEITRNIIKEINRYGYNMAQSNPHLLKTEGGNCQAKSLMFQAYADKYNIPNEIVTEPNHMYNVVTLNDERYIVDLVKGIFSKEENIQKENL